MLRQLNIAVRLLGVLTLLTGIFYPAVVTGIARVAFAHQAGGSMIYEQDHAVGSELIGQEFTRPEYFWGRLSATGPVPYNAAASSGSNLGPLNPQLPAAAAARIEALRKYGAPAERIPVDLVTASASGLDPHISPAAAEFQVTRVATARHMSDEAVRDLVRQCTAGRQFGVLGEARVNVLQLNLLLDRQHPSP